MYIFTVSNIKKFIFDLLFLVSLMTSRDPITNKIRSEVMQADLFKKFAGFDNFVSNCSFKRHQTKKLMFPSNRNKSTDLFCKSIDWFQY